MHKIKVLNQKGFGHIELVVAVLFVAVFAGVGVRVLTQSNAQTPPIGGSSGTLYCTYVASPSKPVVGKAFKVTVTVKNTGAVSFNASNVAQEYRINGTKGTSTVIGGGLKLSTLASGQSKTISWTETIPKTVKSYSDVTKTLIATPTYSVKSYLVNFGTSPTYGLQSSCSSGITWLL